MSRLHSRVLMVLFAAGAAGSALAQPSIYACTDAKGRRLTADRPIAECIDREQTEFSPNGLPRRKIAPPQTAVERAAEEDKARRLAEERIRAKEEAKREHALLGRYPNAAMHDKERAAVHARLDSLKAGAQLRLAALLAERKSVEIELEFYRAAPAKIPHKLRQQLEHLDLEFAAQTKFVAEQDAEKARVNERFDQELARLKQLWGQQPAASTTVARDEAGPRAAPASKAVR